MCGRHPGPCPRALGRALIHVSLLLSFGSGKNKITVLALSHFCPFSYPVVTCVRASRSSIVPVVLVDLIGHLRSPQYSQL